MRQALAVTRSDSGILDTTPTGPNVVTVDFDALSGTKERLESVMGWAPYTALYRVEDGARARLYLVAE